ncbi:unnamed protein product [Ceratitis capitata]|uniref:(Mediterranean fruit fly) hypothetical protein n=1 Tax=Ceratitis capitata TaxID=7213 RepID=A0A811UXY7_CERCA|nr:unnamed protein product [Ceratitis capitata]
MSEQKHIPYTVLLIPQKAAIGIKASPLSTSTPFVVWPTSPTFAISHEIVAVATTFLHAGCISVFLATGGRLNGGIFSIFLS